MPRKLVVLPKEDAAPGAGLTIRAQEEAVPAGAAPEIRRPLPPGYEMSDEFRSAYERMERGGQAVFLTGRAGTGKSTLLEFFRDNTRLKAAVVAPTGTAALNVRGQTIHSFFRFPPRAPATIAVRKLRDRKLYRSLEALVIDEVSMVRADMLDLIDSFLRTNGPHPERPFGGVRVVLVGDPYQLPPVVASGPEAAFVAGHHKTPYFFSARALRASGLHTVELTRVYRQAEARFVELLNAVRDGRTTSELLEALNARCRPGFTPPEDEAYVTLTARNDRADRINQEQLERLPGEFRCYQAELTGKLTGTDARALPGPAALRLKPGAQVMFTKNDPERRWLNGTMGRVRQLRPDAVEVEIAGSGETEWVDPAVWDTVEYRYDEEKRRIEADVVGSFRQMPLVPGYAITVHRSQGKSFDRVVVDLSGGAFAHGQAYVALSRCRTLEGLVLRTPLRRRDVIVDEAVRLFTRYRHRLER